MSPSSFLLMWRNRQKRVEVYSRPDYWDSKAEGLSGAAISMWANNSLNHLYHEETLRQVRQFLPEVKGLSVLDVGCGTGRLSRFFAELGAQVLGIDFSPKTIEIAQGLSKGTNPHYRVQSLHDLNDRQAFDVAFTWGCLTFACKSRQELAQAFQQVHHALKPGGKIIVLEPVHRGFLHRVLDIDLAEFCQVMRETGFEVGEVGQLHFWPARLALAFISLLRGL